MRIKNEVTPPEGWIKIWNRLIIWWIMHELIYSCDPLKLHHFSQLRNWNYHEFNSNIFINFGRVKQNFSSTTKAKMLHFWLDCERPSRFAFSNPTKSKWVFHSWAKHIQNSFCFSNFGDETYPKNNFVLGVEKKVFLGQLTIENKKRWRVDEIFNFDQKQAHEMVVALGTIFGV